MRSPVPASAGAWNASVVAEIVTYGGRTRAATGLGAHLASATQSGDQRQVLTGVAIMSLYVVTLNRLVWHRLFRFVERRYA